MTGPTPSWRDVANRLAERLGHHAYCPDHPESAADDECPFCQDRVAYRLWERKAKRPALAQEQGPMLNVLAHRRGVR